MECYSGSGYAERPRAFYYADRRWLVDGVLHSERHPGRKVFTVRTRAGDLFELSYDEVHDRWQIERNPKKFGISE